MSSRQRWPWKMLRWSLFLCPLPPQSSNYQDGRWSMTRAQPFQSRVPGDLASEGIIQPSTLLQEAGMEKASGPKQAGDLPGAVSKSALPWTPKLRPKLQPLCGGAKLSLGDRVWGGAERTAKRQSGGWSRKDRKKAKLRVEQKGPQKGKVAGGAERTAKRQRLQKGKVAG